MPVDRPTFSESWYRVAELRPRLRSTVQVLRQHYRGRMWHVLQDPSSNQFFRLNEAAYRFVALLDGSKNVAEVWRICSDQLGAPVKTGDVLFEVASLANLRGELQVPEDLVADVQTAYERTRREKKELTGELATTARPDERIGFTVDRINPVAEVVQQNNVFKVRVHLLQMPSVFRPGMEGVGKIDIDRRSYGYIWTRKFINWIRMKLWL